MPFAPCAWSAAISKSRRKSVRTVGGEFFCRDVVADLRLRGALAREESWVCRMLPSSLLALGVRHQHIIFSIIHAVILHASALS